MDYLKDLYIFINNNEKIKSAKFYYSQKQTEILIDNEKNGFLVEIEI